MIGTDKIGTFMASTLEQLDEEHFDELGEHDSLSVGEVMVIVEIRSDENNTEEFSNSTLICSRCTDSRVWVQMGLLDMAKEGIK